MKKMYMNANCNLKCSSIFSLLTKKKKIGQFVLIVRKSRRGTAEKAGVVCRQC